MPTNNTSQISALRENFPSAIIFGCQIHIQKNVDKSLVGLEVTPVIGPETIEQINKRKKKAEIRHNIYKLLWSVECGLSTAHSMDDFDARKEVLRSKYGRYFKSFEHHAETIWKFQVLPGIESEHKCGYNISK